MRLCAVCVLGLLLQCGDVASVPHGDAGATPSGPTVSKVVAGSFYSCALLSDGSVDCWGLHVHSDADAGSVFSVVTTPTALSGLPAVADVTLSNSQPRFTDDNMCAWTKTGALYCWGNNNAGTVGIGSITNDVVEPTPISLPRVADARTSGENTCALLTTGAVEWTDAHALAGILPR